ncbi:hypothetical protein [Terriglobus sp.]|uniref:hypothetical protein n=1 Tax=Terriglobus sp. TaxID=1889013 RepID=UPI003AFFBB2A
MLPLVEGEPASFCAQCGLPQLRVSESVLEAAETLRLESAEEDGAPAVQPGGVTDTLPGALDWPVMLRVLLVATAVGLLPAVLLRDLLFSGAVGFAAMFLLPLLGLASGVAYLRWRPATRMTAGAGAQMGLALGTMLAFAESAVTGIASFALRYGRHNRSLQQNFDAVMQQASAQVRATQPDAPATLFAAMQTPEWHAGWFLVMQGALMLMLVVAGAIAGLVAGALLGARQRGLRAG